MIWLTYRQFRVQAAVAVVAVVAVVLTVAVPHPSVPAAGSLFDALTATQRRVYYAGIVVLAVVPALIGAFWGAPTVARELESGTYRLVWNQSVTRTRWLATKLAVTCTAAAVVAGLMSLAITRWSHSLDGALGSRHGSLPARVTPVSFAMRGVVPVAYAVFAVVLGVAVGLVLRRSLPAVAVTLALFIAVQVAVPQWIRPHLLAPTQVDSAFSRDTLDGIEGGPEVGVRRVTTKAGGPGSWVLSHQLVDTSGRSATLPAWFGQCLPQPGPRELATPLPAGKGGLDGCLDRLTTQGYRDRVRYIAAGRFWALQWAETGLFALVSAGLAGFCFWWTRKRLG